MKSRNVLFVLALACTVVIAAGCAPAATPTAAPAPAATAVPAPTQAATAAPASTTAPAAAPTKESAATPPADAPADLPPTKETPDVTGNVPTSAEEVQRIKPEMLKALIEGKADIVIVDNQPAEAYEMEHVRGAINLPWDTKIKNPSAVSKNKLAVLYCGCAHEEDASDVAMQLITAYGYKQIMLLEGGWDRWTQLGYPTEKGE